MSTGGLDLESIRARKFGSYVHEYKERDVILYALSLGLKAKDLRWVYEGSSQFAPLPTFAIIAAHPAIQLIPLDALIPNCDRSKSLHGEQYMELLSPIPSHARLVTRPQLVDVQDKGPGKGAVAVMRSTTVDELTGKEVAVNEFTGFILGAGGFGPVKGTPAVRPAAATAANNPPARPPDVEVVETTSADQAALYRLNGDYNPLHIDPASSSRVGFPQPILHGLCTLGISVRLVLQHCAGGDPAAFKSVKCRFAQPVLPGEALRLEVWREQGQDRGVTRCVFRTWVMGAAGAGAAGQQQRLAVSNAAVEIFTPATAANAASGTPRSRL